MFYFFQHCVRCITVRSLSNFWQTHGRPFSTTERINARRVTLRVDRKELALGEMHSCSGCVCMLGLGCAGVALCVPVVTLCLLNISRQFQTRSVREEGCSFKISVLCSQVRTQTDAANRGDMSGPSVAAERKTQRNGGYTSPPNPGLLSANSFIPSEGCTRSFMGSVS